MATVSITITDRPDGLTTVLESEPDIPMNGTEPDFENLTAGQGLAIAVLMELADRFGADWRVFLRD